MPTYKMVDTDQLEADLTTVADKIRAKGGTYEALDFPDGFAAAVESLSAGGAEALIASGTSVQSQGYINAECGFAPDVVVLRKNESFDGVPFGAAAYFIQEYGVTKVTTAIPIVEATGLPHPYMNFYIEQRDYGFYAEASVMTGSGSITPVQDTFEWTAIKFTA